MVVVDDVSGWSNTLNLDHHIGNQTPSHLVSDVATDVVFNALHASLPELAACDCASIQHFDTDGCLATWALLNPSKALDVSALMVKSARYGDFYETNGDTADDRHALAVSSLLQECIAEAFDLNSREGLTDAFVRVHELLPEILFHPEKFERHWGPYLRKYDEDRAWLSNATTSHPHQELCAFAEGRLDVDLGAALSFFSSPIVCAWEGSRETGYGYRVVLRPRYSWGYSDDAVGPSPVQDLRPLRRILMQREREAGSRSRWVTSRFDAAVWQLSISRHASALSPDMIEQEILKLWRNSYHPWHSSVPCT